jgi:4-hydroxy-tetrahydrodipicolinate reductase
VADMKIAVMGAAGRMGRELVRTVVAEPGCALAGGTEPAGSGLLGQDLGELAGIGRLGTPVTSDPLELIARSDAIIDFTVPAATVSTAALAAQARIVHVIGTTGFSEADEAAIKAAARHATIIKSGNMSLGVNLIAALTRKVAQTLGEEFDIEVLEMHHRHKVDAPSGTALLLGAAAAQGRGIDLKTRSVRSRDGHTGARGRGDIGFATLRGGSVVGDHSVIFAGDSEQITLSHHAADRAIFSRGAIRAALWGRGKAPGLYSMTDVLGL